MDISRISAVTYMSPVLFTVIVDVVFESAYDKRVVGVLSEMVMI